MCFTTWLVPITVSVFVFRAGSRMKDKSATCMGRSHRHDRYEAASGSVSTTVRRACLPVRLLWNGACGPRSVVSDAQQQTVVGVRVSRKKGMDRPYSCRSFGKFYTRYV